MRLGRSFAACAVVMVSVGCGGGGGGQAGEQKKTYVVPHVFEQKGRISQVAAGDVDGDGVVDLLVLDRTTASVTTHYSTRLRESPTLASPGQATRRLMRGPGAYEGMAHVFVWDTASDMCVGDVTGDGVPDLVVAGGAAKQVGLWSGDVTVSGNLRYHKWRFSGELDFPTIADRVAMGDVNGDGTCDVVALDQTSGQAYVRIQDPLAPGTFFVGNDPPALGACSGLWLLDMDRNGSLDLVTNRPDADAVALVLADAAAGWAIRESPTLRSTGRCMAVGDVDGDGWMDIVVLVEGGQSVVVMGHLSVQPGTFDVTESPLGIAVDEQGLPLTQLCKSGLRSGDRAFFVDETGVIRSPLAMGSEGCPGALRCVTQDGLALADVDRDGLLDILCSPPPGDPDFDLLVAYMIRESPTRRSSGAERLTARLRESPTLPSRGRLCLVGDLDQDGRVDLASGDPDFDLLRIQYCEEGTPPPATTYSSRLRITPTSQTTGLHMEDLDRDGFPDVVCATDRGLEVRWQDAAAPRAFSPVQSLQPPLALEDVAVGDVNNDGCLDLVACTATAPFCVLRDPAQPRGFFPPIPFPPPPPGGLFRSLALGDLDGDGRPDCVALRESPSKASLGRGQGNGFFDVFFDIDVGVLDPRGAAIGDVDGDGRMDVVVCGSDACSVVLQDPLLPLVFGPPQLLRLTGGVRVAVGDVNGDGRCDVIACGDGGVTVSLQLEGAPGTFLPAWSLSSDACGGLALGDVDRDGALDVAFVEQKQGTLVVATGDPDFDLLRIVSLNGLPPGQPVLRYGLALGDFDGDGRCDLVTSAPAGPGALAHAIDHFFDVP